MRGNMQYNRYLHEITKNKITAGFVIIGVLLILYVVICGESQGLLMKQVKSQFVLIPLVYFSMIAINKTFGDNLMISIRSKIVSSNEVARLYLLIGALWLAKIVYFIW